MVKIKRRTGVALNDGDDGDRLAVVEVSWPRVFSSPLALKGISVRKKLTPRITFSKVEQARDTAPIDEHVTVYPINRRGDLHLLRINH